jgi:hypothetical protein
VNYVSRCCGRDRIDFRDFARAGLAAADNTRHGVGRLKEEDVQVSNQPSMSGRARGGVLALALLGVLTLGVGEAPATQVGCGTTITTSTTLEADLIDCPADGLVVGADNITIDLKGHTIDGPGTDDFRWDGVDNGAGHDGVVVKNGTIRDFGGDGVYIDNGGIANSLGGLVLTDNGIGAEVIASQDNSIEKTSVSDSHHFGIIVGESTHTRVQKSTIVRSGADGMLLRFSSNSVIEKNLIVAFGGTGIQVLGGATNEISKNVITTSDVSPFGVFYASDSGLIAKNEIHGFTDVALFVAGGDHTRLEKNSLHDNGLGLLLQGNPFFCCPTGNVASANEVFNNDVGIGIRNMADTLVERNFAHNNRLGIGVQNSTGTVIERNQSDNNAEDGIRVSHPSTTITSNSASYNGDLGIEAVAGVTDGGGNRATGNGNPAQCLNVACSSGGGP